MKRLALLLWLLPALALAQFSPPSMLSAGFNGSAGSGYTGPGDNVSGASVWYGLRAYNRTKAVALANAIQVRRASDNTTQDVPLLSNGNLNIASANSFAGPDGGTGVCTASTSGSSTTLTVSVCTASATLHAGDTLTCSSCVQPVYIASLGTFSGTGAGASGTVNLNIAQNITSQSVTSQVALYARTIYDQSGNGVDQVQTTNGFQAQLLPTCQNSKPCLFFIIGSTQSYAGTLGSSISQPWSTAAVVQRPTYNFVFSAYLSGGGVAGLGWPNATLTAWASAQSTDNVELTALDGATHAIQAVLSGTNSIIVVDGSASSTQNGGTNAFPTAICIGQLYCTGGSPGYMDAYFEEVGLWPVGFTSGQYGALHTNASAYWGTP